LRKKGEGRLGVGEGEKKWSFAKLEREEGEGESKSGIVRDSELFILGDERTRKKSGPGRAKKSLTMCEGAGKSYERFLGVRHKGRGGYSGNWGGEKAMEGRKQGGVGESKRGEASTENDRFRKKNVFGARKKKKGKSAADFEKKGGSFSV